MRLAKFVLVVVVTGFQACKYNTQLKSCVQYVPLVPLSWQQALKADLHHAFAADKFCSWSCLPLLSCSCFWLSLVAGACDSLSMLLTGFLVVNLTRDLGLLAVFQAIAFGCSAAAVLWNWQALSSRLAELHLNKAVLLLASLPFYQAAKAGLLIVGLPVGEYYSGGSC